MAAIWRTASARSGSRSFMSGLLGGHPRRCPLRGRAPSGGVIDAVVSASVHYIRRERGRCLTRGRRFRVGVNKLGKTEPETGRRGGRDGVEPGRTRRANRGGLEPRDERRPEGLRKTTSARGTMPSTNGHPNQWRERIWLPKRDSNV